MSYIISQLKINKVAHHELQSWFVVGRPKTLVEEVDPNLKSLQEIQEHLESILCDSNCLHKFKIKSLKNRSQNPDIFDSRWLTGDKV